MTAAARRRTTVRGWILAIAVLVVLALVLAPTRGDDVLDPRSPGPSGTAAMFAVAEEIGASVTIEDRLPVDVDDTTAVVLHDRMTDRDRDGLRRWVERGGRLVLLDPFSPLNPAVMGEMLVTDLVGPQVREPECDLLAGFVREVASAQWIALQAPADATARCFLIGADGHGLITVPLGAGEIVVTSAVDALTNRELGTADHGRLAIALLAPEGQGQLHVLWGTRLAAGDTPLLSLVPDRAVAVFWALVIASVLFAWSRARRLARPVSERMPVRVPGSELVLAIGELLERHGHRDAAAARLRMDLREELSRALSLPGETPPDVLAEVAAARLPGLDTAGLTGILEDRPVADDAGLAGLAAAIGRVRERLHARGRPAEPAAPADYAQPPRD